MYFDDTGCGCRRRRGCGICGIFGFGGGRRRGGCGGEFNCCRDDRFGERFERCERFESLGNLREGGIVALNNRSFDGERSNVNRNGNGRGGRLDGLYGKEELTRADFAGYYPEARFETVRTERTECSCRR